MLNPKDIEGLNVGEGTDQFSEEMLSEFENGKGEDEDE